MTGKKRRDFGTTAERQSMHPEVTIIIPIYNASAYIKQCLASDSGQTFRALEILRLDDCSTDDSVEIIRQAAVKDRRIRLMISSRNAGAGAARNKGIELARGKYFFFLDADDFLAPQAIEALYDCAEKQALQLCFCSYAVYDQTAGNIRKGGNTTESFLERYRGRTFSWAEVQRFFYQNMFCVPWNRLYQTEFVRNSPIRFPHLKNSEDLFFGEALPVLAVRMGITGLRTPSVYYRVGRPGQVSSTLRNYPHCMTQSLGLLYEFLLAAHRLEGMEKSYHSTALAMLLFSAMASGEPDLMVQYITKHGFRQTGMSGLGVEDFANRADYKSYCEFLAVRIAHFDYYAIGLHEDMEKCGRIHRFLRQHENEKTALWGMGKKGWLLLQELGQAGRGFDYYLDADPVKSGKHAEGITIRRYEDLAEPPDYIMITNTAYFEEIYGRCRQKNTACAILDLDMFFRCDMTLEECMIPGTKT